LGSGGAGPRLTQRANQASGAISAGVGPALKIIIDAKRRTTLFPRHTW
jgi:hypothetical protein